MPTRLLPAVAAVLLLPGCLFGPRLGGSAGASDADEAAATVRRVVPAIEAYYADNGTYAGATVEGLRATYDQTLPVVYLAIQGETYCVSATVGSETRLYRGPGGDVGRGGC
ncbi:MAG: hypothetical protein ACRDOS_12180 [Gaiellaceae bacterium]